MGDLIFCDNPRALIDKVLTETFKLNFEKLPFPNIAVFTLGESPKRDYSSEELYHMLNGVISHLTVGDGEVTTAKVLLIILVKDTENMKQLQLEQRSNTTIHYLHEIPKEIDFELIDIPHRLEGLPLFLDVCNFWVQISDVSQYLLTRLAKSLFESHGIYVVNENISHDCFLTSPHIPWAFHRNNTGFILGLEEDREQIYSSDYPCIYVTKMNLLPTTGEDLNVMGAVCGGTTYPGLVLSRANMPDFEGVEATIRFIKSVIVSAVRGLRLVPVNVKDSQFFTGCVSDKCLWLSRKDRATAGTYGF